MSDPIVNPGLREGSPFESPAIQRQMAEQRVARMADHRMARARESKIRALLGEASPDGWNEEEAALDAEQARLVEVAEGMGP